MSGPRILVVGEGSGAREILRAVNERADWVADAAATASEALSALEAKSYDVVLTALKLPDIDGLRLLKRIRASRPKTKVIVTAAQSTAARVVEAIREHAFDYFSEPLDRDGLLGAIERSLALPDWEDGIEVLSHSPHWIEIRVRCKKVSGDRLAHFMREVKMDLLPDERENIAFAFREMLLNAIEHGGAGDPERTVEVSYVRTDRLILYLITDPGEGFSLDSIPHAAVSNPPSSPTAHVEYRSEHGIRAGGFGILVSRELVDELVYNEKGNRVILVKYLAPDQARTISRRKDG
jgi:CheY-like chemotaxis protein/anti-sigma regulatory factor (Ser/Thr protein kinase)